MDARGDVTLLLDAVRQGQRDAESQLLALVYGELRRLAATYMRRERMDHTLQATALVNEALLRLAGDKIEWQNRAHFFGIAAQAMRRILVEHARARNAQKRGDGEVKVSLDDALLVSAADAFAVIDLDRVLFRLAALDARQARVVELRYFAGLSIEETAEVLGCTSRTVNRDWRMAQAWLRRELSSLDAR